MKYKKILALLFVFYLFGFFLLLENNELYCDQDAKAKRNTPLLHFSNDFVIREWNYTWGGTGRDFAWGLAIDSLENIYLVGYTGSFGAIGYDICLLKYNTTGALQWNYTWGGAGNDYGLAIGLDSSDNIYLTGYTESFGASNRDICLLKYNNTGALQWNYTWGGAGDEYDYAIGLDSLDNIYLAGSTDSFGVVGRDLCLLKYNTTGALQWNYTWGGAGNDYGLAIGLDSSDNIYLTGYTGSFGALSNDVCLLKYNSTGGLQWNYTWGGAGNDYGLAIGLDSSDNIYLTGYTGSFGALSDDVCLLKYNTTGALQWNCTWGGAADDRAYAIGLDSSENIYLAGITYSFWEKNGEICLVKFDNSPPLININSPNQDEFIGSVAPTFAISIIEPLLHTTWYTLDDGITNIVFSGLTGTIRQTEWDKKGNGTVTIRFCANDTAGKERYAEVTVRKDTITPTSSISYIVHKEPNKVNKSTIFTITSDDESGSGVSVIRYRIDDSDWFEYNTPFDLSQYTHGDILISYQAIDEVGNVEEVNTELVKLVRLPSEVPLVIILVTVISTIAGIGVATAVIVLLRKRKRANEVI